jgi:hypothetical protein
MALIINKSYIKYFLLYMKLIPEISIHLGTIL